MWISDTHWGKWGVTWCDSRALTTHWKSERPYTQAGSLGILVPVPLEEIPECYPCHVRINWTLVSHAPSACQDIFNSARGCQDIQREGSLQEKKANTTTHTGRHHGLVSCMLPGALPTSTCTPGASGHFPSCEKRLSSQQSRTYLMTGDRGLRGKQNLIALIARIQTFRNGLAGLTSSYLCYSKWQNNNRPDIYSDTKKEIKWVFFSVCLITCILKIFYYINN